QWAVQASAGTLGITSSTVSYHIGILEDAGLVRVVRSGRYSLVERLQGPAGPLLRAVKLAVEG
ncbi:helix-turn-helix transcriptional regulator, partial [Salmonella enterica subsp. enterica serovar Istanbul]|nr:helix-turn-helix transcriptional regulator [Salmonella enterica subsp. enterica serovar Istanbul]